MWALISGWALLPCVHLIAIVADAPFLNPLPDAIAKFFFCRVMSRESAPTAVLPYDWAGSTARYPNLVALLLNLASSPTLLALFAAAFSLTFNFIGFP